MDTLGLQTKLNNILEDKNTYLIPENIKEGVEILSVTGSAFVPNKINSAKYLFSNNNSLYDNWEYWLNLIDLDSCYNLSYMFYYSYNLITVDLTVFTGEAYTISNMFYNCTNLKSVVLPNQVFTGNQVDYLFHGCSSLTTIENLENMIVRKRFRYLYILLFL